MKKLFPKLATILAAAFSLLVMPAHGATIDQIKSKVYAIKSDTAAIKTTVNDLRTKTANLQSQLNAQIAEMDKLKAALSTLQLLEDKFVDGGVDFSDLLEMVDVTEVKAALEEAKHRRQEFQAMLQDQDLEQFRAEFLALLKGLNTVIMPADSPEVMPLQTFLEKAPTPVVAVLKVATLPVFEEMAQTVSSLAEVKNRLEELGLLSSEFAFSRFEDMNAGIDATAFTVAASRLNELHGANVAAASSWWQLGPQRFCQMAAEGTSQFVLFDLWFYKLNLARLKRAIERVERNGNKLFEEVEGILPTIGIWGWVSIKVPGPGGYERFIKDVQQQVEKQILWVEMISDLVKFVALTKGLCDYVPKKSPVGAGDQVSSGHRDYLPTLTAASIGELRPGSPLQR